MIVANITVFQGDGFGGLIRHNIPFTALSDAEAEYARLSTLLAEKGNGGELVELAGAGSKMSFPRKEMRSVTLDDLAVMNAEHEGFCEAFPNIYRKAAEQQVSGEPPQANPAA